MAEHRIAILNRIAVADAGIELVCNNPTDTIRFEFDAEWSGIAAKTARFSWDGKYIDVPFSGNVVEVPEIYQTNHVYVGVFADNIASTPTKVKSRYSIKCLGGKVVPPSEDVYAEIIALINAGINANDGVGVSSAYMDEAGHLFLTLTNGESIDCGKAQGRDGNDGKDGKDGAGAEEYAAMLESIAEHEAAIEQNASELEAFEKNHPFNLTGNPVQVESFEGMPLNPVTVLEPKHAGSGNPYPAGGGKNKLCLTALDSPNVSNVTVNELGTNAIKLTTTATGSFQQWRGLLKVPESWRGKTFTFSVGEFERDYSGGEPYAYAIETPVPYAEATEEQKIYNSIWNFPGKVTFTIASTTVDIAIFFRIDKTKACPVGKYARWGNIQLEEGSAVTAFEPGENIRPITGYNALELNHVGKNLIPYYSFLSGYSDGGITATINADKTITFTGMATRDAYFYLSTYSSTYTTGYVFPTGEYVLSGCPAGGGTQSYRMALSLYEDGVWQEGGCTDYGSGGRFAVPEGHKVDLYIRFPSGANANGVTFKPMIRLASIADDTYEPYQYTTYTVQIGQTVYGGKFDWLTGKMVMEWGFYELDGTENFRMDSSGIWAGPNGNSFYFDLPSGGELASAPISNMFKGVRRSDTGAFANNTACLAAGGDQFEFIHTNYLTVDDWKAYIAAQHAAGTPVQIAYKLATPIEIQLDAHEILALQGVNTLYGDGEINISGRTDMQAVVSNLLKRIATLEATINS